MFLYGVFQAYIITKTRASANPWNVPEPLQTLEWTLPSPPPFHQFETLPVIKDTDHH